MFFNQLTVGGNYRHAFTAAAAQLLTFVYTTSNTAGACQPPSRMASGATLPYTGLMGGVEQSSGKRPSQGTLPCASGTVSNVKRQRPTRPDSSRRSVTIHGTQPKLH
jgi:hypothetical protein